MCLRIHLFMRNLQLYSKGAKFYSDGAFSPLQSCQLQLHFPKATTNRCPPPPPPPHTQLCYSQAVINISFHFIFFLHFWIWHVLSCTVGGGMCCTHVTLTKQQQRAGSAILQEAHGASFTVACFKVWRKKEILRRKTFICNTPTGFQSQGSVNAITF